MLRHDSPLTEKLATLPEEPGVYLFKDRHERVLYIGKAVNLRSRVRSYFHGEDTTRALPQLAKRIIGKQPKGCANFWKAGRTKS